MVYRHATLLLRTIHTRPSPFVVLLLHTEKPGYIVQDMLRKVSGPKHKGLGRVSLVGHGKHDMHVITTTTNEQ